MLRDVITNIFTCFLNTVFMAWWWLTSTETCSNWIKAQLC